MPLNLKIMSNPLNWLQVFLMFFVIAITLDIITRFVIKQGKENE